MIRDTAMISQPNVKKGDYVEISLGNDLSKHSKGYVFRIRRLDTGDTHVVLTDGSSGTVIRVINSPSIIEERIMSEDQYSENKEKFGEDVMKIEVIPKTVQSFLNSEGGYLYVGVRDAGSLKERLAGLSYDFEKLGIEADKNWEEKSCDVLKKRVIEALVKHLHSSKNIGSLIDIDFPIICNVRIMQIKIEPSPTPWFYKHITKNNKIKRFSVTFGDSTHDRYLDDFYIRQGNSKKRLDTIEEFYNYSVGRFINHPT